MPEYQSNLAFGNSRGQFSETVRVSSNIQTFCWNVRTDPVTTTDDNGRTFLGSGLIGKREWHQHNIAELKVGHNRHRSRYPTHG